MHFLKYVLFSKFLGIAESLFAKAVDCTGSNLLDRMMIYIQQSLNYIGKYVAIDDTYVH